MTLGKTNIGVTLYRLPKKFKEPKETRDIFFSFQDANGHTLVRNTTGNILFSFDPATGHMEVEGLNTDRYLNFSYRDYPPGPNPDGHMIENT